MAAELTTEEIPVKIDENPVKIDENPVTTDEKPVTTTQELPLTTDEKPVTTPPPEVVALEPKRKPGRPAGSKNKEPGKPRKPRAKAVMVPVEPVEPVAIEPPHEVPALPGSRRIPTEARDSREALMLRLLSEQAGARQRNKVALWKSWFQ